VVTEALSVALLFYPVLGLALQNTFRFCFGLW